MASVDFYAQTSQDRKREVWEALKREGLADQVKALAAVFPIAAVEVEKQGNVTARWRA